MAWYVAGSVRVVHPICKDIPCLERALLSRDRDRPSVEARWVKRSTTVLVHDIEMPWKQGAKHIFGDTIFSAESFKVQPLIAGVDLSDKVRSSVDVAGELNHTLGKVEGIRLSGFFSAVSNMTDVAYADKKSLEIETACVKWIAILKMCPGASTLWEHISEESTEEAWKSNLEVVESIIGVRSPATA